MTGFARAEGATDSCVWAWEVKSVNGKGLDVRVRVPRGFDGVESAARDRTTKGFKRGNISLSLDIAWTQPMARLHVNKDVLAQVLVAVDQVQTVLPTAIAPSVDGILGLRGVLEYIEDEPDVNERIQVENALLAGLDLALEQLTEGRNGEGQRLGGVLHDQLAEIETLCEQAGALAFMLPDAIRQRLRDQVAALTQDFAAVDGDRLAQEVAVLMTKADVREELDRLTAHIAAARDLLGEGLAVGRRLDFLCQEFNREANTLCAKSSDTDLTRIGLALKATIEQFREQVQNIE